MVAMIFWDDFITQFRKITVINFVSIFGCTPVGRGLRLYDGSGLKTF